MTQEQRNHFGNLLLLCGPCHKLVDKLSPRAYTVEKLRSWKSSNESSRSDLLNKSISNHSELESKLVEHYLAEVYTAFTGQSEELTALITGGDSFPLAEYCISAPNIKAVCPLFTAIGERPVKNVSVEIEIHLLVGKRSAYNDDQTFTRLHAGRSVPVWDSPIKARQIPIDWDDLRRIVTKFWADNGYFEQENEFNTLSLGGSPMIFPTMTTMYRVTQNTRHMLYRKEFMQLANGQVSVTSQPVIATQD